MRQSGFTLLEIMLVLLLIGVALAVVIPTLEAPDSASRLRNDAERFAALVRAGHEEALLRGRDMGISLSRNGYEFMVWQENQWQTLERDRILTTRELPDAITIDFLPGEAVWHQALEAEQQSTNSFFEDAFFEEDEPGQEPDLYLWSSGDLSPGEIRFQSAQDRHRFYRVVLSEAGAVEVMGSQEGAGS